ncbi:unnamed protein product [Polarella glacialis]|uniref:ABM domain-containing protein n=1 Tax=Polarella glacialis TaxID=89957 RepID=A0A813LUA9_POLGL|nr:unnamed protein product [Polarella glacialis]CAE8738028.1 unnamed protein product [Polarella glacialis]|eukprot:CAMPEP_0115097120 /NCGR_PEP_ID=MMETSP0227-20121206/30229_1 /TAXON_ID=89957 /ORGANISM="Polarella glacialis, Strain CCMP 1383" /LENGTH=233 /DNA_ID=CAMNT_0002491183 /DNA_START=74 /DNA_END=775 /DNA_ORIENTATION=-
MAQKRAPKKPRVVSTVALAVGLATLGAFHSVFVAPRKASTPPRSPSALGRNAAPSMLDGLLKLPDIFTEAFEEAQDMFGQGSGELESMEVSSLGMAQDGLPKNGLLQSMSIRAAAGSERRLARQVGKLVASAQADPAVLSASAIQNKEDPCDFVVFLRYSSMRQMETHQTGPSFKPLLEAMEQQLEQPIGLYLADEQLGHIGMARHPFGPGGEGGRDDAIYSSRKRADGSDAR